MHEELVASHVGALYDRDGDDDGSGFEQPALRDFAIVGAGVKITLKGRTVACIRS